MSKETSRSGIGLGSLLTVLFVGLKLTHAISWSWLWVLAPTWIPLAVFCVCAAFVVILTYLFTK